MPVSIKDKVVLITGASSGFGRDAARLFAREGCITILVARRQERLIALAEEILAIGGTTRLFAVDICDREKMDGVIQAVLEEFGRIDILFNNAGFGRLKWLEKLDPDRDIDEQLNVNLRGLIQVTRSVLPSMLARRSGTIINCASEASFIAAPLYSIYSATKFGVRGFTDGLRREVMSFGVKVCGIYPGPAKTEFSLHSGSQETKTEMNLPGWLSMSSEHVAKRVVKLAQHPRPTVVIPWYYRIVNVFEAAFPGLVDWVLQIIFVRKAHRLN